MANGVIIVNVLRSRPLWRRKPSAALGLVAAARSVAPSQLFSVLFQHQASFASNAAQPGGEEPLGYYIAAKLALKRIFLGENAVSQNENLKQASSAAQPDVSAPLPDPASPEGLDWSDEAAYRRALGPLADPNYTEMQQAGTTLSGDISQPSGAPESTAKINVLKDATPEPSPAIEDSASASVTSQQEDKKGGAEKEKKPGERAAAAATGTDLQVKAALQKHIF